MTHRGLPKSPEGGALLDVEGMAAYTGLTVRQVRRFVTSGEAPTSARIGRRRYFRREDVDAWIAAKFEGAKSA